MPRRLPLGTYTMQRLRVDPLLLLKAARLRVPAQAAFSGLTAGWGHGIDVPPCSPIQVTVPQGLGVSARSGLLVSRALLEAGDVVIRRGLRVTSICRTPPDIARSMPLAEAVAIADMALHNGLVELDELTTYPIGRELRFARLLRVARLAEPAAESRMESLLRMVLIKARLPRPQVQDNRRQNEILRAGYDLLRYTAPDVLGRPEAVAAEVRARLKRRYAGATTVARRLPPPG